MQLLHSSRSKRLTLTARLVSLWAVAIAVLISAGVNAVLLEDHSCYKNLDPATATRMDCYSKGVTGECRAALTAPSEALQEFDTRALLLLPFVFARPWKARSRPRWAR